MKYTISVAALAIGASAINPTLVRRDSPSLVQRDLATIESVIGIVSTDIATLNNSAAAWDGGSPDELTKNADTLNSDITSGTSTVSGTSELSLQDALSLQSLVGGLQTQGQTLVDSLAAKKQQFEAAGLCDTIREKSDSLNTNSQALIKAIVSKVPTEAQSIAQNLAAGFTGVLAQNSANFAEGNCTNSGTASTGGGSGSSSSSAVPSASSSSGASSTSASSTGVATSKPTSAGGSGTSGGYPTNGTTTTGSGSGSTPVVTAGAAIAAAPLAAAFGLAAMIL